jgi:hypothetical protein
MHFKIIDIVICIGWMGAKADKAGVVQIDTQRKNGRST